MALARTHRPLWRAEVCLPCGACTRRCPASVFDELAAEPESLRGRVSREVAFPAGEQRPPVPPCQAACPLGQDVPGYIAALAAGDFDRALAVIQRSNPLPAVCGWLCRRACMQACVRARLDFAVDIRGLKRAALQQAERRPVAAPRGRRDGELVVVGGGPAGLACAAALRRIGWRVRLLEAAAEPGGLLRWAVPAFELPRAALRADIEAIVASGVEIACGRRVDSAAALRDLLDGGARAVVLATGAGRATALGIPGETLAGCSDGLTFARRWADGAAGERLSGPAVVAGSGAMAVAVARMALRAGAAPVHLVMRRGRAEAAVDAEALGRAEAEGVELLTDCWPVAAAGGQRLEAVQIAPLVYGPPDAVGRRWPLAPAGDRPEQQLPAATFVAAADRRPELGWLAGAGGGLTGPLGLLAVDGRSYRTRMPGVYAVGEVAAGARNAVEVMAMAARAAAAVDRDCRGGGA